MTTIKEKLAPIYSTLLPADLLEIEIPPEKFATCLACPNTTKKKVSRYNTKCCDYHPALPNYMVGAILSDTRPELAYGQEMMRKKIKGQVGVTPYAIFQSADYARRFKASREAKRITQAQADDLLCPYNKEKLCSIWDYRSELCATFHCVSSSGRKGNSFWKMMRSLLTTIENKLVVAVMDRMNYPSKKLELQWRKAIAMDITRKDGTLNQERYQAMWREHVGAEEAYYKSCHETLQTFTKEEIRNLLGIDLTMYTKKTALMAIDLHENILPDLMKLDQNHQTWLDLVERKNLKVKQNTIKVTPAQLLLLRGFNGTTPTIEMVHAGYLLKQNITVLASELLVAGALSTA